MINYGARRVWKGGVDYDAIVDDKMCVCVCVSDKAGINHLLDYTAAADNEFVFSKS